ncbi:MAG: HAD family phosphatase [Verrucomicrobiales bacterium]|jgi:HAD superfamily hydrolase (TIGR01509 family)|nr:HAD family phosphatase [Verrucomicrobiales bacterium]MDP4793265.1 HAD family phosphatase [Verrucomicrobiales bacterium]
MILDLPERDFDGYIFDCDGTLVDSMPLHFKAWSASFVHHGAPWEWTEDEFYANAGVPDRITVMELNERFDADLCPDSIHEFKAEWYARHLHEIEAVAAVADLARRYHAEGRRISVASGSDISLVVPSLERVGLLELFDIIITPADVKHGKPAPDMFLLAADRMAVAPESCLVFEDGQAGIDAANAAGMASVFVPSRLL